MTLTMPTRERRSSARRRACLGGSLSVAAFMPEIACRVHDLSLTGARIVVAADAVLPHLLELTVPCRGRSCRARLVWRDGAQAGLALLDGSEAEAVPQSEPAPASPSSRLH